MDLQKTIVDLFATHPKVDVFYMTSDQQFFEQKANADFHASKLVKKGVAEVTRGISEQLQEAITASNANVAHPEISTILTTEQLAAKANEDQLAQDALTKEIGGAAAAIKKIVTQEDLDANPELIEDGVQVGDTIEIPAPITVNNEIVKSALEVALETPEADRTPVQKGLITKAANAAIKAPAAAAQIDNKNTDPNTQA